MKIRKILVVITATFIRRMISVQGDMKNNGQSDYVLGSLTLVATNINVTLLLQIVL